jgi:hypothetical protein
MTKRYALSPIIIIAEIKARIVVILLLTNSLIIFLSLVNTMSGISGSGNSLTRMRRSSNVWSARGASILAVYNFIRRA